jgi:hypothetical protein
MKNKNKIEVYCNECNSFRCIVKNVTHIKTRYIIDEKGNYSHICHACAHKKLVEKRIKEGYFHDLNKIKANKTRISPLNKGDVYGNFTVISDVPERTEYISKKTGKKTVRATWLCKCKCENIVRRTTTDLITKRGTKQCPTCAYKQRPQSTERRTDIERLYNLSIQSRVKHSKGRILNNLSLEDFSKLIIQKCYYCGEPPKQVTYDKNKIVKDRTFMKNGIDRIDSNGNYDIHNCVPCCKTCNIMKSSLTKNDFINHIEKIYNFNKTINKKYDNR